MTTEFKFLSESDTWRFRIVDPDDSVAWVEIVNSRRDYRQQVMLPCIHNDAIALAIAESVRDAYTDGYVQGRMEVNR